MKPNVKVGFIRLRIGLSLRMSKNKPLVATLCRRTTKTSRCLNLGSYNYLGFGSFDEYCTPRVIESLKKFSASTCSSRVDAGTGSSLCIRSRTISSLCGCLTLVVSVIRNYICA